MREERSRGGEVERMREKRMRRQRPGMSLDVREPSYTSLFLFLEEKKEAEKEKGRRAEDEGGQGTKGPEEGAGRKKKKPFSGPLLSRGRTYVRIILVIRVIRIIPVIPV